MTTLNALLSICLQIDVVAVGEEGDETALVGAKHGGVVLGETGQDIWMGMVELIQITIGDDGELWRHSVQELF